MQPQRIMIIAGEASGDMLAAEVVHEVRRKLALRPDSAFRPQFFGAGGPLMAAAGVELAFDLTQHAVVGLIEVLKNYAKFRRLFDQLLQLARDREPDLIICVDFGGFNRRFAHAVKQMVRRRTGPFQNWQPKIVQYVSPQVWASRPGRARKMAPDLDLLLTIFPFEKAWYAQRLPGFRVEFVGHPIVDRHFRTAAVAPAPHLPSSRSPEAPSTPSVILLPGSRCGELTRHLPVLLGAWKLIRTAIPTATATMVLPNESLVPLAHNLMAGQSAGAPTIVVGQLAETLRTATIALASTGTVTMECAWFGVPTIALYRTSWSTYQIGRRIITVKYLAMPNLLADDVIFPEFIQNDATPDRLAAAALQLLRDPTGRAAVQKRLAEIIASLGGPGASQRAAKAILSL